MFRLQVGLALVCLALFPAICQARVVAANIKTSLQQHVTGFLRALTAVTTHPVCPWCERGREVGTDGGVRESGGGQGGVCRQKVTAHFRRAPLCRYSDIYLGSFTFDAAGGKISVHTLSAVRGQRFLFFDGR